MSTTDEPLRTAAPAAPPTPETGLDAAQVADRVAAGRVNRADVDTGRSVGQILRANVVTPFNGLLATLFVIILCTGRIQNALFGFVIVANTAIGVFQEVRAKRTLDRLAVLNAPRARVVRDGAVAEIAVEDVVADELLELRTGDQVCADGVVTVSAGLEVDESLLTGESDPIDKSPGDEVRSGSIVVAGTGRFLATAVGAEAYATALAAEAKRFTLTHSELVHGTNRLLRWISLLMLVVGPLLLWSQFHSDDNHGWRDAVTGAVAALVGMVPEGLVLLTSLAFMIGAVTLSRRDTLVQELPAVEGLARVDVVCLDKTGTLTHGDVVFDEVQLLVGADADDVDEALALAANVPDPNATALALQERFPAATWTATGGVPFSSARKWSALGTAERGTWVLGAPEMVLPDPVDDHERTARDRADRIAAQGRRVLLLAAAPGRLVGHEKDASLPAQLRPHALVVLAERVRDDAPDTMRYFLEQGVALKVISGDNPRTVGAVAASVGVPGVSGADDAVDARTLPEDLDELAEVLETKSVFGRVTPHQKRAVVAALQRKGHVVAMTGDGVNDAMALKDADIGVAMGNGSAATRSVAQLVLLDGRFSHLPDVVAEGRRVIANIERASSLFLVKNVYSLVLALITVVTVGAYLFEPIQLSLISNLTIGVPAFFLALGPNRRRYVPGFLRRVLRFSVPCGIVVGAAAYTGYAVIRAIDSSAGVAGGRTVATLVTLMCALWILVVLARPLAGWKVLLVGAMVAVIAVIVVVPAFATDVFLLHPTPKRVLVALVVGAAGAALVEVTARGVAFATRHRGGMDGDGVA
ncbi:cation-transporting ATPase E [Jatrophihabitans endophyticus]|uniref:Cation-transporting ATPase E n=1 Tax=Jatrophihabitans endophyticus TaxID=1206085 RepID=A0A1M5R324_9ACTN|nr:HAD-IC family P-type ATPase [Jatrophihabitans endophyticus]SHH20183.1 cation-transporting ATPase E [Jatrophihabitans endophyticus]